MVWYFIGVYIINRTLHGRLEIRNFCSRVSALEEKFRISARPCNILYLPVGKIITTEGLIKLMYWVESGSYLLEKIHFKYLVTETSFCEVLIYNEE